MKVRGVMGPEAKDKKLIEILGGLLSGGMRSCGGEQTRVTSNEFSKTWRWLNAAVLCA